MRTISLLTLTLLFSLLHAQAASPRVVTITTADNANTSTNLLSLAQAIRDLQDGDTIHFNIPGPAPHIIQTPPDGYEYIRANNVTIDAYTEPGSAPNTNPILAPNNANIAVVLDSRNGNYKLMNYEGYTPND